MLLPRAISPKKIIRHQALDVGLIVSSLEDLMEASPCSFGSGYWITSCEDPDCYSFQRHSMTAINHWWSMVIVAVIDLAWRSLSRLHLDTKIPIWSPMFRIQLRERSQRKCLSLSEAVTVLLGRTGWISTVWTIWAAWTSRRVVSGCCHIRHCPSSETLVPLVIVACT